MHWAAICALACSLIAGGITWWQTREPYLSKGVVVGLPSLLPESILEGETITGRDINHGAQRALDRHGLHNVVLSYDLYRAGRARLPLEDVLENMRKDIKIKGASLPNAWDISVQYSDPVVAKKVCDRLISRLIQEVTEVRTASLQAGIDFLEDRIRSHTKEASPDAVVARRQLEELHMQLGHLKLRHKLHEREQSARLEMLDPASLPVGNWAQEYEPWSVMGAATLGLIAGGLPAWAWQRRRERLAAAAE